MKKSMVALSIGLMLVLAVFAIGAAKQVLHMYTSFDANQAQVYIQAFEKAYPNIEVKWVRLSAGQALARIEAEASNPQASIWYGGSSTSFIAAATEGLLAPYTDSLGWQYVPKQFKDPEGRWVGIYIGFIGFVSNKNFLKKAGVPAPTSWQDLLKPQFKGEIAKAYPFTSGTAYTTLMGMLTAIGSPKPGFDPQDIAYLKAFHAQVGDYTESGTACISLVGQGEFGVGIAFSHDILAKGIAKGFPVVMTFPKEGTSYEVGGMALIKGGPEPELAKIFYNWALSAQAQNLYQPFYRVPLNPEAKVAKGAVTLADVKALPVDAAWYGAHKDQIIDEWHKITGE